MDDLVSVRVRCPYCGESIPAEVDRSAGSQEYVEDCSVCCRPIEMRISIDEQGRPRVAARREDD
jgi:hypothetical protein